jgi:hypothetical protein
VRVQDVIERLLRGPELSPPTAMAPDSGAGVDGPVGGNGDYDAPPPTPEVDPLVDLPEAGSAPEPEATPEPDPDEHAEAEAPGGEPSGVEPPPLPELRSETRLRLQASAELVESLGLSFHLGGALERIIAAATEGSGGTESLREAIWLLDRYITLLEQRPVGADIHRTSARLARTGEALAELRAVSDSLRDAAPKPAVMTTGVPYTHPPSVPAPVGTPATAPPSQETVAPDSPPDPPASVARELGRTAFRWALLVAAVVLIVLALTLIGDWHG